MIRRYHQKITFPEVFKEFAKLHIKALQFFPITHRISPVAPEGIKIHEIHKAESLEILIFADFNSLFHSMDGALGSECLREPWPSKISRIFPTEITSYPLSFKISSAVVPVGFNA